MKFVAFRIQNFRSIIDTGWCSLSLDNITAIIGQNESGKSSILEALYAFWTKKLNPDDLRSDGGIPEISCSFELLATELDAALKKYSVPGSVSAAISAKKMRVPLSARWDGNKELSLAIHLADKDIEKTLLDAGKSREALDAAAALVTEAAAANAAAQAAAQTAASPEQPKPAETPAKPAVPPKPSLTATELVAAIYGACPQCVIFEEEASLLPNEIDISADGKFELQGAGNVGARNFLEVAGLDLKSLTNLPQRIAESTLNRANDKITADFQLFWTQTIGKNTRIRLECELKYHSTTAGEKTGRPYLVFWIADGSEKLYPKQRSKGVRWFLSFYLQMTASAQKSIQRIFLLDEPGANLHGKAQEDVLRLMERIKASCQIIYATHSPQLVRLESLYRVLAAQRDDIDNDRSPTRIIETHKLATASTETLSVIYASMGWSVAYQQVIPQSGNVLIEELSGYYYLQAFWFITGAKKKAYFLPANGADNIPRTAYLFLGWGIDSIVVIDDDSKGRSVFNELKKNLFLDDTAKANTRMYKIEGAEGIEDLFSPADFRAHVLGDVSAQTGEKNSAYVKGAGVSKIVLAVKFLLAVKEGKISLATFEEVTQNRIGGLVSEIESRLP